jgi:hypothetical protein
VSFRANQRARIQQLEQQLSDAEYELSRLEAETISHKRKRDKISNLEAYQDTLQQRINQLEGELASQRLNRQTFIQMASTDSKGRVIVSSIVKLPTQPRGKLSTSWSGSLVCKQGTIGVSDKLTVFIKTLHPDRMSEKAKKDIREEFEMMKELQDTMVCLYIYIIYIYIYICIYIIYIYI